MAESAAGQAAAAVLAERDAIQANLLELDGGFTRRLLDGATLTGQTRERWDVASDALAGLWETYLAYSAVVDRVGALGTGARSPPGAARSARGGRCPRPSRRSGRSWASGSTRPRRRCRPTCRGRPA